MNLENFHDGVEDVKDEFEMKTGVLFTKETLEQAWNSKKDLRKDIFVYLLKLKGAHEKYIDALEKQ